MDFRIGGAAQKRSGSFQHALIYVVFRGGNDNKKNLVPTPSLQCNEGSKRAIQRDTSKKDNNNKKTGASAPDSKATSTFHSTHRLLLSVCDNWLIFDFRIKVPIPKSVPPSGRISFISVVRYAEAIQYQLDTMVARSSQANAKTVRESNPMRFDPVKSYYVNYLNLIVITIIWTLLETF